MVAGAEAGHPLLNDKQEAERQRESKEEMTCVFRLRKPDPKQHTSYSRTTPPKPSQTASLTGDQVQMSETGGHLPFKPLQLCSETPSQSTNPDVICTKLFLNLYTMLGLMDCLKI